MDVLEELLKRALTQRRELLNQITGGEFFPQTGMLVEAIGESQKFLIAQGTETIGDLIDAEAAFLGQSFIEGTGCTGIGATGGNQGITEIDDHRINAIQGFGVERLGLDTGIAFSSFLRAHDVPPVEQSPDRRPLLSCSACTGKYAAFMKARRACG